MPKPKYTTISNERLQQIAAEAAKKLPELIGERETDILSDFHAAVQDAHEDEDAKMTVSRKTSDVVQLEDPDQAKLPLED